MKQNVNKPFDTIDHARFNWFHAKSVFTTSMGVLADGYDLTSIGIVLPLTLADFGLKSLSSLQSSLLAASALLGSAVGAILFGLLANKGRKAFYGIDMIIMAVAALAQAFVTNIPELIAIRFILGIGVGADYVLSPLIIGEHSNKNDRGKSMALGFGMTWGFGAVFAALLYLGLISFHVSDFYVWRIVLAAGAIPAALVIYLRRMMPETTRFLARIEGDTTKMAEVIEKVTGQSSDAPFEPLAIKDTQTIGYYLKTQWQRFATACLLWFLFDIVAYSGILFGPSLIAKGIGLTPGTFNLIMEFGFVLPGGIMALILIDRWGRKPLQILGFLGMASSLIVFNYFQKETIIFPVIGLMLYGLENFMQQAGPGSVSASGVLGIELAPTKVRGIIQSFTVASGRIGAAISAFVFPSIFHAFGESFAIYFLASIALVAAAVTIFGVPETKRQSLEDSANEQIFSMTDMREIS